MHYYRKGYDVCTGDVCPEGYHEITEQEYEMVRNTLQEIADTKLELKKSDYKAIKHSEGLIPDEDYADIRAAREQLREHIRYLEKLLEE